MDTLNKFFKNCLTCSCCFGGGVSKAKAKPVSDMSDVDVDDDDRQQQRNSKKDVPPEITVTSTSMNQKVNPVFDYEETDRISVNDLNRNKMINSVHTFNNSNKFGGSSIADSQFITDLSNNTTASGIPLLKLTLLGDGGVGKSCLILQYMYNEFMEEYEPTSPSAYRNTVMLEGDEVQYNIIDTAGQEDYAAIQESYLKNSDGFFLLFDLTNRDSFESVRIHRENLLRVKDRQPIAIALVGNKCDLVDDIQIKRHEAEELATSFGIPYYQTSALTRDNVDKTFSEMLIRIKHIKMANMPPKPQQQQIEYSNDGKKNSVHSNKHRFGIHDKGTEKSQEKKEKKQKKLQEKTDTNTNINSKIQNLKSHVNRGFVTNLFSKK